MTLHPLLFGPQVSGRENKRRKVGPKGSASSSGKSASGSRDWVLKKKDQMRRRGYGAVPQDTKYTGRKRKHIT